MTATGSVSDSPTNGYLSISEPAPDGFDSNAGGETEPQCGDGTGTPFADWLDERHRYINNPVIDDLPGHNYIYNPDGTRRDPFDDAGNDTGNGGSEEIPEVGKYGIGGEPQTTSQRVLSWARANALLLAVIAALIIYIMYRRKK